MHTFTHITHTYPPTHTLTHTDTHTQKHTYTQTQTNENDISLEKKTFGYTNADVEVLHLTSWTHLFIQFSYSSGREGLYIACYFIPPGAC